MKKALFIHGFGGSKESRTGKVVAAVLAEYDIETITETFDLLNVPKTLRQIKSLILENDVQLLLGTSLGGFYTLAYPGDIAKIAINPCMEPSIEIPKLLDSKISNKTISDFEKYEKYAYSSNFNGRTKGIFGTKDELFGDKFYIDFRTYHGGLMNTFTFEGGHHGAVGAEDAIRAAYESLQLKNLTESKLNETYANFFPKEKWMDDDIKQKIYNLFVEGYADIGGLAGGNTIEDFYSKADMIKINKKDGQIAAACVYRFDKGGRKLVYCTANKNHPKGKEALIQIMKNDIKMSDKTGFWAEVSEQPLHMYLKYANAPVINANEMKKYMMEISKGKENFHDFDQSSLDKIDPKFQSEYSQAYVRQLGDGKYHAKVGVGVLPSEKVFEAILTK